MDENKSVEEEIEESLRICEELLNQNETENLMPENPIQDDWEELTEKTPDESPEESSEEIREEVPEEAAEKYQILDEIPKKTTTPQIERIPAAKPEPIKPEPEQKQTKKQKTVSKQKTPKKRGILRTIISFLICIVIAFAVAVFITKFVANHTTVDGTSMEPALHDGDNLIVEKLSYMMGEPQRFDVIVFRHTESTNYIKRIIGLPGEKVRIEEGKIYINEAPIYDTYGDGTMEDGGIAEETITLGSDEYFVLGDNRDGSEDSRDENVGPVKADQIIGRAWLRVTPFEQFGFIEN